MSELLLHGPVAAVLLAALATYLWRALGVALSGRIDTRSALFEWVACVAYALLAGLIARMIVLPIGPLAETALIDRLGSAVLALVIFFVTRRNLALGVGAGFLLLVLLTWGRGPDG